MPNPQSVLYRVAKVLQQQEQQTTNLLPAVYPANTVNGLDYKYYEGNWNNLPDFPSLNPVKTGTATNFDISIADRTTQYGFSFTGYVTVPADGQYTFYANSDDGSNVYIDNVLVVTNDGLHAAHENSGTVGLQAGKHAITGVFFQQGGGQTFQVSYEGMGVSKQQIPGSALYRVTPDDQGNLLPASYPENTVNGLNYKYYEGSWNTLPDFTALSPVKTGTTNDFDLTAANRNSRYGFSFTGYVNVPADGKYNFYTSSDDGSKLYIDNVPVIDNDGLHAAVEQSGTIGLQAGKHAITGVYFQQSGGRTFTVSYEGMIISKQNIPASELFISSTNTASRSVNTVANQAVVIPVNTTVSALTAQSQVVPKTSIVGGSKFAVSNGLKVYPNPTTDFVNLNITAAGGSNKLTIAVYNSAGLLLISSPLNVTQMNTLYKLDMTNLSAGVYTIILTFENGEKITSIVIKG